MYPILVFGAVHLIFALDLAHEAKVAWAKGFARGHY